MWALVISGDRTRTAARIRVALTSVSESGPAGHAYIAGIESTDDFGFVLPKQYQRTILDCISCIIQSKLSANPKPNKKRGRC